MELKDRLRLIREKLGKNQKEMASALGIGYRSWQGYEDGSNVPGGSVIEGLSRLRVDLNWLFTGHGSPILPYGRGSKNTCGWWAKRIKNIRGGLTAKEFVEKLGLRGDVEQWSKTIEDIESQKIDPDYSFMVVLLTELKLNPLWLFGFDYPMYMDDFEKENENRTKNEIDIDILIDIIEESEVYESLNQNQLTPRKKAELICELYKIKKQKNMPGRQGQSDPNKTCDEPPKWF